MNEQISLCVRFVDKTESEKHFVREDFLTFVCVENGTTAEALADQCLEELNEVGLPSHLSDHSATLAWLNLNTGLPPPKLPLRAID